jgi:DNA-binding response OmpR family regulator
VSTRLLVVEDDPDIAASLRALLEREGYSVVQAGSIAEARVALREDLDGMLLDWRLPDGEGIDLLKEIRKTSDLPVLMVTARVDVIDRVLGLEIGADDYVTKPVEPRELLARLRARLRAHRRTGAAPSAVPAPRRRIERSGVSLDLDTREVTFEGRAIPTTRMEFGMLAVLLEHPGRVFSREELLNRVWGYERTPTTRTVDTHVVQLRTKLRPELIESVRGIGYRFVREDREPQDLTKDEP